MPNKTDLNATPYYDDFDKGKNFQQILSRPGYAVQARELTQMQSILKNQIEQVGNFAYQEGSMVIPGGFTTVGSLPAVKLETAFGGVTIDATRYLNETVITGTTSGVKAIILHSANAATVNDVASPPMLYLRYISVGTDNVTSTFIAGETISSDTTLSHASVAFSANAASCQVIATSPTVNTMGAQIEAGVYWLRGNFVEIEKEYIVLDNVGKLSSHRIGFNIKEEIVTPETDTSLLDNASGTSNYAAKGGHRLKVSASLASLPLSSVADSSFIELVQVKNGREKNKVEVKLGGLLETLARRTYDESGDYTVRPFTFQILETVTLDANVGIYSNGEITDNGNVASNDFLTCKVSPGKAYLRGYDIEKISFSNVDIPKARDFNSENTAVTTYDVGNFLNITNIYGMPDISFISGETTPYKQISLFDTETSSTGRGSSSGTRIGVARARSIEFVSGVGGQTTATYKLFLFDFRPFTTLTLSGTPAPTLEASHSTGGVQIKGVSSKATGWVFADGTGTATVVLTNVSGTFIAGEKITASDSAEADLIVENSANADLTITRAITKNVSEVRQVFMSDDDGGQNFSADVVLDALPTTESFILLDSSSASGDDIEDHIISELDKLPMGLERAATGGTGSSIKQAKLKFAEKNVSLFKMNKEYVKTHLTASNSGTSDTSYELRKQFVTTSSSVGVVTISAGTNEIFVSHSEVDYMISILSAGSGGTGQQGDVVSASTGFSGGGTNTVTITNQSIFGNGAKLKITGTLLKTSAIAKTKSTKLMKQVKVVPGATHAYGTRPTDKTVSLGRADVFKVVAILDSEATDTDATTPQLTLGTIIGNFTKGEVVTGGTSGAIGRIIDTSSPMSFVYKRGTSLKFTAADTITGFSSNATAAVSIVTDGSTNITNKFSLDTGQRDNYYDISRIVRNPGVFPPLGRLLVVYDYLEHGTGDFFTVDSYSDVANQMTYSNIPKYSATKVDPDDPAPSGEYNLQDVFDIRPRAEDIAGTSANVEVVDEITGNSFDFANRQFDGVGASSVNFIKPGSLITTDFEYYIGYRGRLSLTRSGVFKFEKGQSSDNPAFPPENPASMQMATISVPPYTFKPQDVILSRIKNQRFTMKDIGKLEERVNNVEYYTQLSLLERNADSFQIQDANGLDRFKSGFVVDNFAGHSVGDVLHGDYKCSIDMVKKELRPLCVTKGIQLQESLSTNAERVSAGYARTGDLVTLPYKEVVFQDQPYASRVERICPLLLSNWVGVIELNPAGDEWFETEYAPDLIINVEGNFDTFSAQNASAVGTVWNAWQTAWAGSSTSTVQDWGAGVQRTTTTTFGTQARTGVRTDIVPQIDLESQGSRVIQRAFIPFCRARNITFEGTQFLPNIRLYAFFDGQEINRYITPLSGFTTDAADVSGVVQAAAPLITSAAGKCRGIFALPDPKIEGNPVFRTGEVSFRLTSSTTDVRTKDPETAGDAVYYAVGILETEQETIIATRNATLQSRTVNEQNAISSANSSSTPLPIAADDGDWDSCAEDPIAQTFFIDIENGNNKVGDSQFAGATPAVAEGRFITSVDIFFQDKDINLPVTIELRSTGLDGVHGSAPGRRTLPFGRVVLEPSEISVSDDGTVATRCVFPSPVYVKSMTEYCVLLSAHSPKYKVWISRMGETEIGGSRTITEQPHVGVLFKSHNARTWAPSMTEDLKFVINCAEFDTARPGVFKLVNEALPSRRLVNHPLTFANGNTALLVNHKNHGMYDTTNNVLISGVISEAETTLAAAMDSGATSLTLTTSTNFDDTTGKFAYNSSSEWWIKIEDEIMKYTAISDTTVSSISRAQDSTAAVSHPTGAKIELYMLHKVPFTEINKTHTSLANINIDSYTVLLTSSPTITGGSTEATNGGSEVFASENACYDTGHPTISTMVPNLTEIGTTLQPITATSPSGVQSPYTGVALVDAIPMELNDNLDFNVPYMIASGINETLENGGKKSLTLNLTLTSANADVSPVIDLGRASFLATTNRLNSIDTITDVYPQALFDASSDPLGDDNSAIYLTKKITLQNPATAVKVTFAGYRHSSAEIELYYKILRSDDASEFDDLSYEPFNEDGSPDVAVKSSTDKMNFQEYEYSAGVTDDGLGTPLDEFISFQIKIVMKGTNTAEPPRLKDLRAIALAI